MKYVCAPRQGECRDADSDKRHDHFGERFEITRGDPVVDGEFDEIRRKERDQRVTEKRYQREGRSTLVRAREA